MASKMAAGRLVLKRSFSLIEGPSAVSGETGGMDHWRKLALFVAIPSVLLCYVNAYIKDRENAELPKPEFKPYSHMFFRTKRFPWGDGNHTLFHDKHANPLPNGYED